MDRIAPPYPKGDLRRMLAVLGAIDSRHCTLVQIAAATGLDKKTVTSLIAQAGEQACVTINKTGATYSIEAWGPVLKKDGAKKSFDRCIKRTYNCGIETRVTAMTTAPVDPCAIILAKIKAVEDQNPGRGGRRNAAVAFALGVLDDLLEEMKTALQADVAQSPAGHEQRPSD